MRMACDFCSSVLATDAEEALSRQVGSRRVAGVPPSRARKEWTRKHLSIRSAALQIPRRRNRLHRLLWGRGYPMTSSPAEASGKYWDKRSDPTEATKRRWFDSELIVKHCNAKIAGKPLSGRGAGIRARLQQFAHEQPISRGVSVACGSARTELGLLMAGLVETFDLYEASRVRLEQARSYATKHNVVDRVRFNLVTGPDLPDVENADLVYWKAALHHMLDTRAAVEWSRDALRAGGLLVVDEYVGPNRFQWTKLSLEASDRVRQALPERFFHNPRDPAKPYPRLTPRVNRDKLIAQDPTEAADSENIVPAIGDVFPGAEIIPTGGAVYHLALRGVMDNFQPEDDPIIQLVLLADDLLERQGEFHHATAFARRP